MKIVSSGATEACWRFERQDSARVSSLNPIYCNRNKLWAPIGQQLLLSAKTQQSQLPFIAKWDSFK